MQGRSWLRIHSIMTDAAMSVLVLGAFAACERAPADLPATKANLQIAVETLPHTHVFKEVAITFSVRDRDRCTDQNDAKTCPGVAGLPVVAFVQAKDFLQEQTLQPGMLEDKGNGLYTWYSNMPIFGGNCLGLRFEKEGQIYSQIFTLDTSRGGGERYFCDPNKDGTPDFAHQIRWNTSTGPVRADGKAVTFSVELSRSFNPPPLNTAEPYKNSFETLRPAELTGQAPTVKLMAGTGALATEIATLTPVYAGKGVYNVQRAFTAADLTGQDTRTFWLHISFADDKTCTVDGNDETEYYFAVRK